MKYSSIHAILLCAASLGVVGVSAEESSVVDVMPAPPTGIEADPGFFPTLQDSAVLSGPQGGDPDYFRSSGGALNAPDLPYQAAADEFWNYQTQPNPMSRLHLQLKQKGKNPMGRLHLQLKQKGKIPWVGCTSSSSKKGKNPMGRSHL